MTIDATTPTTTGADGTTPATTPVQVTTPPQSQPQQQLPPTVDPSDGKLWKDKFHGTQGRIRQIEAQYAQQEGALQAQMEGLQNTLRERDATIATLQQQVQQAGTQLEAVPGMQEQITTLQHQSALAERYKAAMQYPTLLNAQVEVERTTEDGQTVTERVNPLLNLIENTTLEGDALTATLRQMATALPGQQTVSTPTPVMEGAVPPSPEPVEDELSALRKQAQDIQDRINDGDHTAWNEQGPIWQKIRELELAGA